MKYILISCIIFFSGCSFINKSLIKFYCKEKYEYNRELIEICIEENTYTKPEVKCNKIRSSDKPKGLCNQIID